MGLAVHYEKIAEATSANLMRLRERLTEASDPDRLEEIRRGLDANIEICNDLLQRIRDALDALNAADPESLALQLAKATRHNVELENKLADCGDRIKHLEATLRHRDRTINDLAGQVNPAEIARLRAENEHLRAQLTKLTEENGELGAESGGGASDRPDPDAAKADAKSAGKAKKPGISKVLRTKNAQEQPRPRSRRHKKRNRRLTDQPTAICPRPQNHTPKNNAISKTTSEAKQPPLPPARENRSHHKSEGFIVKLERDRLEILDQAGHKITTNIEALADQAVFTKLKLYAPVTYAVTATDASGTPLGVENLQPTGARK